MLWIGIQMTEVCSAGFPHSDICGSLDMCSSPQLFAAYHVFLRLLVPGHPPCALFCLTCFSVLFIPVCRLAWRLFRSVSSGFSSSHKFLVWRSLFDQFLDVLSNVKFSMCYRLFWQPPDKITFYLIWSLPKYPNGDGEVRTHDPLLARQVLSQLSYAPRLN